MVKAALLYVELSPEEAEAEARSENQQQPFGWLDSSQAGQSEVTLFAVVLGWDEGQGKAG